MLQAIKSFSNQIFRRFGYEFRPLTKKKCHLAPTEFSVHPKSIKYTLPYKNYYIDLPLDKAKSIREPLEEKIYTIATRLAVKRNGSRKSQTIRTCYKSYFANALPRSASETLGLEKGEVPELDNEPHWLIYYPWHSDSIAKKKKDVQAGMSKNEPGSFSTAANLTALTDFETRRTCDLLKSIQAKGYISDYSSSTPVSGYILFNEDSHFKWLITHGFHRCSICRALEFDDIEVRLLNIIYRDEVDFWPAVASGTYTRESALKVFDNIFYSRSSQKHNNWLMENMERSVLKNQKVLNGVNTRTHPSRTQRVPAEF